MQRKEDKSNPVVTTLYKAGNAVAGVTDPSNPNFNVSTAAAIAFAAKAIWSHDFYSLLACGLFTTGAVRQYGVDKSIALVKSAPGALLTKINGLFSSKAEEEKVAAPAANVTPNFN